MGALECITTFLGACGALADKRKMLKLYAGILLFLILLQIAAAVLLFMYHENPENIPKEFEILFYCIFALYVLTQGFLYKWAEHTR